MENNTSVIIRKVLRNFYRAIILAILITLVLMGQSKDHWWNSQLFIGWASFIFIFRTFYGRRKNNVTLHWAPFLLRFKASLGTCCLAGIIFGLGLYEAFSIVVTFQLGLEEGILILAICWFTLSAMWIGFYTVRRDPRVPQVLIRPIDFLLTMFGVILVLFGIYKVLLSPLKIEDEVIPRKHEIKIFVSDSNFKDSKIHKRPQVNAWGLLIFSGHASVSVQKKIKQPLESVCSINDFLIKKTGLIQSFIIRYRRLFIILRHERSCFIMSSGAARIGSGSLQRSRQI